MSGSNLQYPAGSPHSSQCSDLLQQLLVLHQPEAKLHQPQPTSHLLHGLSENIWKKRPRLWFWSLRGATTSKHIIFILSHPVSELFWTWELGVDVNSLSPNRNLMMWVSGRKHHREVCHLSPNLQILKAPLHRGKQNGNDGLPEQHQQLSSDWNRKKSRNIMLPLQDSCKI